MEKEILFRGKRVIDGKWVESYCPLGEMHSGTVTYDFDSKTVCQYTGLTDKNGRKIFEGDIVYFEKEFPNFPSLSGNCRVAYFKGHFDLWKVKKTENLSGKCPFSNIESEYCEVIGNIFDNPELIGDQP